MVYIAPPQSLLHLYQRMTTALANLTFHDVAAQEAFVALPLKLYIGQQPASFVGNMTLRSVGGSVFCGDDVQPFSPSLGLALPFSFDTVCHWWSPDFFTPSPTELLFALAAYTLSLPPLQGPELRLLCAHDIYAEPNCEAIYEASLAFLTQYSTTFAPLVPLVATTTVETLRLDLQLVQLVTTTTSNRGVELFSQGLFNVTSPRDVAWTFFSWCYLYEWVVARREVVSFVGDIGHITSISAVVNPLTLSLDAQEIPTYVSFSSLACVFYLTCVISCITSITVLYVLAVRLDVEPWNLYQINRVVGHVYVGRSLLIVRSATALWLLNTSRLELARFGVGTRLDAPRLDPIKVALGAGELTWLVYLLNDVLSVATTAHTVRYALKSTLCTWIVSVVVAVVWPQAYTASIAPNCAYVNMDQLLVCQRATVTIGRWSGVRWNLGFVVCSVLGFALLEQRRRGAPPTPPAAASCHLNSTAYYMLYVWSVDDTVTYMDRASAFLAGLVSLRWRQRMLVFDVKRWCCYAYDLEAYPPLSPLRQIHAALALHALPSID
ncbi:hypothetical protein SDRG_08003 [Saprolegnia diclina VS20]|uniref:Uncharacterized protein n=1 Tax=Saprolegnia diclina (strain VS20) TaxID=1156394 RepID=T0QLK3_SAPDV|nr:hypothetical protein SDRG_08003 [Saprolegnia diclina VS20]EQC34685.1 hypothetical protein SDRG_08003 [Saprolegnia diclina VS20]|eukprot:XP_008612091.1 hypothetical protein SDRG_08003 [Saprolegnia diclina VS20]